MTRDDDELQLDDGPPSAAGVTVTPTADVEPSAWPRGTLPSGAGPAAAAPPALVRPSAARLLEGVLTLGREIHLGMDERALVERFLDTITELFPGRWMSIRLVDPRTLERSLVRAVGGRLAATSLQGPLVLKRSSLDKTRLDPQLAASERVALQDAPASPFVGAVGGFTIPLVAGGELYGALDVGYGAEATLADEDERTLIPIANQLSVSLRNVRLHAEAGLLRDYLGKLIDHADALIVGVDRDWRITVLNQALARLIGRAPAQMIGRDVRNFLPPDERVRLMAVLTDGMAGRPTTSVDVPIEARDGRQVRTVWNVAAVMGRGRRVEAMVAVGQDVTRIRSLERQVIQAEKLATLGQLAAGVVHELNNPLTSVIVYADFLQKKAERIVADGVETLDAADVEKLRRILEGAERILNFSRSLVQYAKPASDQLDRVPLNDVIRQSLSFCEHVLRKGRVRLECDLADELPLVYAVRGEIQQIVINLVTNGVQAITAAAGVLRVRSWRLDDAMVAFSVEDDGCGVRVEDRARIFEPFFTTKTDGRGTGLGLSIVRNILDRHGGAVDVESAPGRTVFTVTLPIRP